MNSTLSNWSTRAVSAADVVAHIKSGDRIFIHGAAATPTPLIEAIAARRDLENVRLYHLHTNGPAPFAEPGREKEFRSVSLFTGGPLRGPVADGRAVHEGAQVEIGGNDRYVAMCRRHFKEALAPR